MKQKLLLLLVTLSLLVDIDWQSARAADLPNPYYQFVGQCTWYAAEMRPDLRFNIGDAHTWASVSEAHGYLVDTVPEVAAIAVWAPDKAGAYGAGHVAYVAEVRDSTHFRVQEYNWGFPRSYGERWVTWQDGIRFIHTSGGYNPPAPPNPDVRYAYTISPFSARVGDTVIITIGAEDIAGHRAVEQISASVSSLGIGDIQGSAGTIRWNTVGFAPGTYSILLRAKLSGWTGNIATKQITYTLTNSSIPTESTPAGVPALSQPSNGSVLQENTAVTLSWNTAQNAVNYRVELWGDNYSLMVPCDWQPGTSCQIGTMWPGFTYFWHVKSRNLSGQESDWSSTWSFTIQGPTSTPSPMPSMTSTPLPGVPGAPTLREPADGGIYPQSQDIWFSWNYSTGAEEYYLEYWGGPYGTLNSGWITDSAYHIGTMWPGTYSWHVKGRNRIGMESDWSTTWTFTISQPASTDTPQPATATPATFAGNIAPQGQRRPDGINSNFAFDGNLATFWTDGLGHAFRLELVLPGTFTINEILVWDRPQNSPDNNQINALIIRLSNGLEKRFGMDSQGVRCIDVALSSPQSVTAVTLIADDASGNNGLSEVEIWVGAKTSGPICSNRSSIP